MTVLEIPDEQAEALRAKAAAEGLSLAEWIRLLAEQPLTSATAHRHIADEILEIGRDLPHEIAAAMPADGASEHDHYIYGWPKKEA